MTDGVTTVTESVPGALSEGGVRAIGWPGFAHLGLSLRYSALIAALFVLVYGGADAVARLHTHRVDLSVALDRMMPFVPESTLVYSSLYAMFALAPFILRTEREIRTLARVLAWEIVIAAPFFVALPMQDPTTPVDLGRFESAFRLADLINLRYNQFPSLHVTFAFTMGVVLARLLPLPGRIGFLVWSAAIAASTLLTWQHVVVDVAGALVLAGSVLFVAGRESPSPSRR